MQGKHVKHFAGFSSQRTTDRRLKLLREEGYIEKVKILYGISSLYKLTSREKKILDVSIKNDSIRIEQIIHNIAMLGSVVFFIKKYNVQLNNVVSEKQLHDMQGFGNRKHVVDFMFAIKNKRFGIEIGTLVLCQDNGQRF